MYVLRGRAADPESDRERTRALLDRVRDTGEPAIRVWRPHRQLAFGRRDAGSEGYEQATAVARELGFPPVERDVGGRAVAYTGSTVAFARIDPVEDIRSGLNERYERVASAAQRALWRLGVPAQRGEPDHSFCPGGHSLQWQGKLVGLAQRVTAGAALTSGVLVVDSHEAIAAVLDDVYAALDVPFDPASVGSVAKAGGRTDDVLPTLERLLVGDAEPTVETVRQT